MLITRRHALCRVLNNSVKKPGSTGEWKKVFIYYYKLLPGVKHSFEILFMAVSGSRYINIVRPFFNSKLRSDG